MNLPSTILHIEIAKLEGKFIARCDATYISAAGGPSNTYGGGSYVFLKSESELGAWLALLTEKVKP